jgi:hypothetical protein
VDAIFGDAEPVDDACARMFTDGYDVIGAPRCPIVHLRPPRELKAGEVFGTIVMQ